MRIDTTELDRFEADFAATGAIELDEWDEAEDAVLEMERLVERVHAARLCGA